MVVAGIVLVLLIFALVALSALEEEALAPGILVGVLVLLGIVILSLEISQDSYKQGQVDALTGKVKYELVVNADSTKTWEEVK